MFWKAAAVASIVAIFYLADCLHESGNIGPADFVSTASAGELGDAAHQIDWAIVDQDAVGRTQRTEVEGGWLVLVANEHRGFFGLTFVPDPNHSWRIAR